MAEIVNFPSEQNIEELKKETSSLNTAAVEQAETLMQAALQNVSDEDLCATLNQMIDENSPKPDSEGHCEVCDEMPAEAMAAMHASKEDDEDETPAEETPSEYELDLKDLEAFIKVPFVDLITQSRTMEDSIKNLESAKEMMDQIGMKGDPMGIARGNFLDQATTFTGKSADEFYEQYPTLVSEAKRLHALLEKLLKFYGDVRHSTSFLSHSMVESAEAKATSIEARGLQGNEEWMLKRNRKTIEAFKFRTSFDPLFTKLEYPQNLIETFKKFRDEGPEKAMDLVNKFFTTTFGDQLGKNFRASLHIMLRGENAEATDENRVDDLFFAYWLAINYSREEKSGKCAYVKTLVMNVYDIHSGIYDLPGGPELMKATLQTMSLLMRMILSEAGPIKTVIQNYKARHDEVMRSYEAMRDSILANAEEVPFGGSRIIDVFPDVDIEAIASELQSDREEVAEIEAAALEHTAECEQDDEFIPSDSSGEDTEDGPHVAN